MNDMCIIATVYRASAETKWLYVSIWPLARMWRKFIFNRTNCSESSHTIRTNAKQRSVSEMHLTILMARDLLTNNLILLPTIEAKGENDDEDREAPKYENFTCSRWGREKKQTRKGGWRLSHDVGWALNGKSLRKCAFSHSERDFSLSRLSSAHAQFCGRKWKCVLQCFPAFLNNFHVYDVLVENPVKKLKSENIHIQLKSSQRSI